MKMLRLLFATALVAAVPPFAAVAQTSAPPPAAAASVAPAGKPDRRPPTPAEQRDSATTAGDLRPERRVTPQLNIPLTKSGPPKPSLVPAPRGTAAPSGGVDDSAARCGALADAQARDQCRNNLGR